MVPNIFISSTIQDLHYLRDAIRDTISDLGYSPFMSEYGDFGFLPNMSVEDSCYNSMRESDLAIIIIGKRYGSKSFNGLSITHNEFRTAKKHKIPVICLIDKEVLSFKKVYQAAKNSTQLFPEMDNPIDTFEFINEFIESEVNNGYRPFETVNDARGNIKKQVAHIFGNLLRERAGAIKSGIQDIISEIKTLRHELVPDKISKSDSLFLRTTRLLIDQKNDILGTLLKTVNEMDIDKGIINFINSSSLDETISKSNWSFKIENVEDFMRLERRVEKFIPRYSSVTEMVPIEIIDKYPNKYLSWSTDLEEKIVSINPLTKAYLNYLFDQIKNEASGEPLYFN
jgi:hypothetical protein